MSIESWPYFIQIKKCEKGQYVKKFICEKYVPHIHCRQIPSQYTIYNMWNQNRCSIIGRYTIINILILYIMKCIGKCVLHMH